MEHESRFCVRFHCGFRSTQRTVIIESFLSNSRYLGFTIRHTTIQIQFQRFDQRQRVFRLLVRS